MAARSGHQIVAVYRDEGISGSNRDKRPGFDAMHKDASRRKFDLVMAWSVDRLGRSLQDLIGFLSELHSLDIDLGLHQQGIDTTTPAGKAMFQMMGVFAEFERSMIVERVRAGVARAKASGTKSGKAFGRPRTVRLWRLLAGPAFTRSPLNSASRLARFNGSRTGENGPARRRADIGRSYAVDPRTIRAIAGVGRLSVR